ncbi:MAG: VOC family protein [Actinomycetota bacterium]
MDRQVAGWPIWVGLVAEDLEKQRRFYRDVLGLSELDEGGDWVWFDMGWPKLFEILALDPSLPQYEERRFQVAFVTHDIRHSRQELIERGALPVTDIEGGIDSHQYWCYFRDAEGNVFELVQPLGSPWSSMGTGPGQIVGWPVWIGVVCESLEKQQGFYRDVLGFHQLAENDRVVEFDLGWPNLLELELRNSSPVHERRGYHVSFAVGDIPGARMELMRRGLEPVGDIAGGPQDGGYWCYFRDAEGNIFATSQRLGPPWMG